MAANQNLPGLGHNAGQALVAIEVRFFNSLARRAGSDAGQQQLLLAAGATVGDLIDHFRIPRQDIFLVLRNGRDISSGLYEAGNVNVHAVLEDGDVIAFSGPVPYSYGYGAPIV